MLLGGLRLVPLFLAFALQSASSSGGQLDQTNYDRLFPLSAKACSLTQVDRKDATNGGAFGHAVIYLRGACLDTKYAYPQIRLCSADELNHPETSGVGISVNKVFASANWVAIPGYDLFFWGGVRTDEALTPTDYQSLKLRIKQGRFLSGIEAKRNFASAALTPEEREHALIDESLDTDFAINWGRDAYCMNYPLTSRQLQQGIEFLNLLNIQFADPSRLRKHRPLALDKEMLAKLGVDFTASEGDLENRWNGLVENCAHTTHNTLAAMSIDTPKNIRPFLLAQPFHLTTPADSLVELYERASLNEVKTRSEVAEEIVDFCRSSQDLNALESASFSNFRAGIVAEHIPFHDVDNQLYNRTLTMPVLLPWNIPSIKAIRSTLMKPHAGNLDSALQKSYRQLAERLQLISNENSVEKILSHANAQLDVAQWLEARSAEDAKLMSFPINRRKINDCATKLYRTWIRELITTQELIQRQAGSNGLHLSHQGDQQLKL